jgi:Meiotically up-regulated gene 113
MSEVSATRSCWGSRRIDSTRPATISYTDGNLGIADMDRLYIIAEIKRTAQENGGVPIGRGRFAAQTGLRNSDCSGRFWARWGDALLEAGFEPRALQGAYKEEELIEHLVGFVRELGRFPVDEELRIKATNDKTFPSHTIWRSHFANKDGFVNRVRDYCSTRASLADVAAMCAAASPTDAATRDTASAIVDTREIFASVYLLRSGRHYKIGRSNAAGRREYELAIQLPERAQKVHEIRTDDPVGIEAYWHNRFAAKRKNGEWFELDAKDVAVFARRKFM